MDHSPPNRHMALSWTAAMPAIIAMIALTVAFAISVATHPEYSELLRWPM